MPPKFLSLAEVLYIHQNQVTLYGGDSSVRDLESLKSAIAQPESGVAGNYFHADLFEMAAAYLFHLVSNHPFMDGNKRTSAVAALLFLHRNGVQLQVDEDGLYEITMKAAQGQADKQEIAEHFRNLAP